MWFWFAKWFNAAADSSQFYALVEPAFGSPEDHDFLHPPADRAYLTRRRTVTVRSATSDEVVALIEVISPDVKRNDDALAAVVGKVQHAIQSGIGVILLDLFPPGPRDPNGLHPLVWSSFQDTDFTLPPDKRLTQVAYAAGRVKRAFIEPVAVGDAVPDLPLFLTPELHIVVPLSATYETAWNDMPRRWQDVLDPKV